MSASNPAQHGGLSGKNPEASFLALLNKSPELRGLGVLCIQGDRARILRGPQVVAGLSQRYLVIEDDGKVVGPSAVEISEIVEEGLFALLSCSTAAITALGAVGSAVPTGGAGLLMMIPASASAAACGMGIGKTINAATGSWRNKQLAASDSYKAISYVIDGIQVVSAGASMVKAARTLRAFSLARAGGNSKLLSSPHASGAVRKSFAKALGSEGVAHHLKGAASAGATKAVYLTKAEFSAIGKAIRADLVGAAGDLFGSATSPEGVLNKSYHLFILELGG